jgi:hypothetical protein
MCRRKWARHTVVHGRRVRVGPGCGLSEQIRVQDSRRLCGTGRVSTKGKPLQNISRSYKAGRSRRGLKQSTRICLRLRSDCSYSKPGNTRLSCEKHH